MNREDEIRRLLAGAGFEDRDGYWTSGTKTVTERDIAMMPVSYQQLVCEALYGRVKRRAFILDVDGERSAADKQWAETGVGEGDPGVPFSHG